MQGGPIPLCVAIYDTKAKYNHPELPYRAGMDSIDQLVRIARERRSVKFGFKKAFIEYIKKIHEVNK